MKRNRWPEEAEQRRIEAISLFASIAELSDSVMLAIEDNDLHHAAKTARPVSYTHLTLPTSDLV